MADTPYPVPANMAEATAAQRAAAAFYLTRIEALLAVLNGPEALAFEQALAAEIEEGVPIGTSASANLPSAASWFNSIRIGLEADWSQFNATANPPVAPPAGGGEVVVEPT